ncbi:MAG: SusC/RagA family TonB-linked outer membrane protein [Bacteroidales bacterium]
MKKLVLVFTLLLFVIHVNAQNPITGNPQNPSTGNPQNLITGKVTDNTNSPLPGVYVTVKNTLRGTMTDGQGNYSLEASPTDSLVFSMISMAKQTILVDGKTVINVTLLTATSMLNEVVVVGYGTQKAKDLTAPIATVQGSQIQKQIAPNPVQALQGHVAGVQIISSGIPGSQSTVKIRGVGSIGDYANPLYVVDGTFVNNIDFLSPDDIKSLTVLKDASAAAIYGVRAANGVIIITTKEGAVGKPVISYQGYFGYQLPVNIMPLATKDQYIQLLNDANASTPGYVPKQASAYPTSTDWYRKLVNPASTTSHDINISGGTEKSTYAFGGNYFLQNGIEKYPNSYQRFNLRGSINQTVNDFLKAGLNIIMSKYTKVIPNDGAFFQAFVNPPVYPVFNPNNTAAFPVKFDAPQNYGFGDSYGNPVAGAYYWDDLEKGIELVFSPYFEIDFIPNKLVYKFSYNSDIIYSNARSYTPQYVVGGSQGVTESQLSKTSSNSSSQIVDNLLTYSDKVGKNSFSVMLGQETRITQTAFLTGSAVEVPGIDEQSKYIVLGSINDRNATDGASRFNGLSLFTRGTYNYSDKYLLTVTFRADASSKYQQKWGYFPSVGLGWILSDEPFLKNSKKINYLKIRASWGLLGNDNVPANSAVILGQTGAAASAVFDSRLVPGVGAQTVVQNYLKWEVVNEFDVGSDFGFFDNHLTGSLDLYRRLTSKVVFFAPIATGGGVAQLLGNNGDVVNEGVELSLTWNKKVSDQLTFSLGGNITTTYNKVTRLQGREYIPDAIIRGNYSTRTQVGHPIGSFYGFEIAGVYQSESQAFLDPVVQDVKAPGFFRYKDQNGDKVIDDADKIFLGSPIPWLVAGVDFNLNYRRLDASISLSGQYGNKLINAKRMDRDIFTDGNYDEDFYKHRWTPTNLTNKYPSAYAYNFGFIQQANNFFIESGYFVKIQNVQVGYTFPKTGIVSGLRIYVAAQRPYTFFTYKGFTPEIGGTPTASGVDNSVYPLQSIYTLGVNASF